MIVLAAGMQRAGSAWFFNLTNDLIVASGFSNVRSIREHYGLNDLLVYKNCMLRGISDPRKLYRLLKPHLAGHTFTIRKHGHLHPYLRALSRVGIVKPMYIYRDPRDVALSAFERGQRLREKGKDDVFSRLNTLEDAIAYTASLLTTWERWMELPYALTLRYEDLNVNPTEEMLRISEFLGLDVSSRAVSEVVKKYTDIQEKDPEGPLHLNQGKAGRHENEMDASEKNLCMSYFGSYLDRMGYSS